MILKDFMRGDVSIFSDTNHVGGEGGAVMESGDYLKDRISRMPHFVLEAGQEDFEFVQKIRDGIREEGLARLPFPEISIGFDMSQLANDEQSSGTKLARLMIIAYEEESRPDYAFTAMVNWSEDGRFDWQELPKAKKVGDFADPASTMIAIIDLLVSVLVISLINKHTRREIVDLTKKQSELLPALPGNAYTVVRTPMTVTAPSESDGEGGTGRHVRMHLRRGHVHTVRYGRGRKKTRRQFFMPVWVNADLEATGKIKHDHYDVLAGVTT